MTNFSTSCGKAIRHPLVSRFRLKLLLLFIKLDAEMRARGDGLRHQHVRLEHPEGTVQLWVNCRRVR